MYFPYKPHGLECSQRKINGKENDSESTAYTCVTEQTGDESICRR